MGVSISDISEHKPCVTRHWTGLAYAVGTKLRYFVVDACGREYMGFEVGRKDDGIKGW